MSQATDQALVSPRAAARAAAAASAGFIAIAVDSVDGSIPAGGTGATAGAYDTANNRDAMLATVTEIKATVNELITDLGTMGLPITAN